MFSFPGELRGLILPAHPWRNSIQVYTCAEPVAFKMTILRAGDEVYCERFWSKTAAICCVLCDDCLQDCPALHLSDSLFFALPGTLLVLEALIGPELDCDGPDYWCQCVPGHMVIPEAPRAQPGQLTMWEKEKRRRGVALLTGITFTNVGYRSTRPHTNCIRMTHKLTANIS